MDLKKFQRGFTLVEALIAIVVLVIGILGVLQFLPSAVKLARRSRLTTQAAFLTQGKVEEYLAKSYSELATGVVEPRAPMVSDTTSQLYYFETEVQIVYLDEDLNEVGTDEGIKQIKATTYWQEGSQERQEQLTTFVSRY